MKIDNPNYWPTHKKILQEEMDKLDEVSYAEIASDPYCQSAMDLEKKVFPQRNGNKEELFHSFGGFCGSIGKIMILFIILGAWLIYCLF